MIINIDLVAFENLHAGQDKNNSQIMINNLIATDNRYHRIGNQKKTKKIFEKVRMVKNDLFNWTNSEIDLREVFSRK